MVILLLIAFLSAAIATVYLLYKRQFRFWDKHGFPHTKPTIPWGDVQGIITKNTIGVAVNNVYKQYENERFIGLWILFKPSLMIRDPELVKSVFVRDFMSFHDRGMYVNEKDDPLSAHIFSIAGSKWRNLRVKLTPTFTSGKMKLMFPILVQCSKHFKSILEEPASKGEVIEVKDYAARFTTDIISLAAFGIETDSLHNPKAEFRHNGQQLFEPTASEAIKFFFFAMVPSIAEFFRMRVIRKSISDFFMNAIKESMDYREQNNVRRNDFLDLLIQLKNKGSIEGADEKDLTKFTFEEAAAQAFVFFAAGFETSSTTMQFALYELAKNPDIQQRAREEINEVLERHNGEITYESVSEMDYLGRVIDETLRLYPPVPFLQRECNKDYKIPETDLVIPKGVQIIIDCLGLHRDPKHFPDPEKFDPDRFTEEEKAKRHHYAYLPFGEGPRNCIGNRFGRMQTRVGMLTLLVNYEFSVSKETIMPMEFDQKSFILSPKGGMYLKVNKLKQ